MTALVDTATGEIVEACTADEARALTDRIKGHADSLWSLLLEAHDRQAWKALGYARWEDYVRGEFDRTKQWSYQLLDQGRAVLAIAEASGSNAFDLSVNDAREIKPHLDEITDEIRREVTPDLPPERVREIVDEKVNQHRAVAEREAKAREAMRDVRDIPQQDPSRVERERQAIGAINGLADLDDPDDLAAGWSPHARYHLDRIEEAQWVLDRLRAARENAA